MVPYTSDSVPYDFLVFVTVIFHGSAVQSPAKFCVSFVYLPPRGVNGRGNGGRVAASCTMKNRRRAIGASDATLPTATARDRANAASTVALHRA